MGVITCFSRNISFTLHTGVYTSLKTDEVTVNTYTTPFDLNRRLGASNPSMETSKSTTALGQNWRSLTIVISLGTDLNRFVLLEVVKVLESSKVQETILAQKVKAMLFQNIPPTTEVNEPFLTM